MSFSKNDKRNWLGASESYNQLLHKISDDQADGERYFIGIMDAYKFAFALGLKKTKPNEINQISTSDSVKIWGVATIDPEGEMKNLVEVAYSSLNEDPYIIVEKLAYIGLNEIEKLVSEDNFTFTQLIS